jgi:hypothetical protein
MPMLHSLSDAEWAQIISGSVHPASQFGDGSPIAVPKGRQPPGVYQIGEVQARSWIDVGRPSGTFTPRLAAS